jgi:hypothetical protein
MIPLETLPLLHKEQPVFLLASSHRTGSTLVQRLLNSCPRMMIWGEHLAHLSVFSREFRLLQEWGIQHADERDTFLQKGYDQFVPNILPQDTELVDAARLYVAGLFGIPAARLGRPIWGFKEVRYGAQVALFLQACFPEARFIHLTRNPLDCFFSMKRLEESSGEWKRKWTETAMYNWAGINESFLKLGEEIHKLLKVEFDEMIADPAVFLGKLSTFLDIPEQEFDASVFKTRVRWDKSLNCEDKIQQDGLANTLDEEGRTLLRDSYLVEIAEQYGYQIQV